MTKGRRSDFGMAKGKISELVVLQREGDLTSVWQRGRYLK